MLSRSSRLLIVSAANAGFAAFQKKVEEGQANALLPAQKRKLRSFYHTSRAVAHLPNVLDVARTIVYNDYEPKPTTSEYNTSKGSNTRSTSSKNSSNSSSIRKPQRRSTVRRPLSLSGSNGKVQNKKSRQQKTLSREKRVGANTSNVTAASSSSTFSSPFRSRVSTSVSKKGAERSTKRHTSPPAHPSAARNGSLSPPARISVEAMQKSRKQAVKVAVRRAESVKAASRPAVAADHPMQKKKPLTAKEKALHQQFSFFRRAVYKKTKLKSRPKLDERIRQLWFLLQKKNVQRQRHVSLAVRVLRPKALGSLRAGKSMKKGTGSTVSHRKRMSNRSLSSATMKLKNPILAKTKKENEKQQFLKFFQTVSAKTGGGRSSSRPLHQRRIRELWKLLVGKPISLQERVSIAVRVLGSEAKGSSTKIMEKSAKRFKKTSALRRPFGVTSHTARSSFTPHKKNASLSGTSSSTVPSLPLKSKEEQREAEFKPFRSAVLTSFKVSPRRRRKVEKALRRCWPRICSRQNSFDQKVLEGVKAIEKRFPKLPHSTSASQSTLPLAPVVGALPRPPGGVTLATASKAVVTPLDRRKGSGAGAGTPSHLAGRAGRLPVSRRHLSKRHVEFLSFYRAMLMTGHISRDPGERAKAIRFLWTNTKNFKKIEQRIKLAEAHLAGAIRIPLVAPLSDGSGNASSPNTPVSRDTTGSTVATTVIPKNSS